MFKVINNYLILNIYVVRACSNYINLTKYLSIRLDI